MLTRWPAVLVAPERGCRIMVPNVLGDAHAICSSMHDRTREREGIGTRGRHKTRKMTGSSEDYGMQFPVAVALCLGLGFFSSMISHVLAKVIEISCG